MFTTNLSRLSASIFVISGIFFSQIDSASALVWNWAYSAPGVEASGTLTTNDRPDDLGFYQVTAITGSRNDESITGLHPTGTSIPGNEPFVLDNIISLNPEQLTGDGLGFSTDGGNFVNVFFADFLETPGYFEVFSAEPFIPGFENFGPEDSEIPVSFSASPIDIPEPTSILGIILLGVFGGLLRVKH